MISFVVTSIIIYFGMAALLVCLGRAKGPVNFDEGLNFNGLFQDYSGLPELKDFLARDGTHLFYRHYPARSKRVVVLIHGSGWHSRYFLPLARFISSEGVAQVYTPDLRGHGVSPKRRGDVDYIRQLEDDLADFLAMIQKEGIEEIILGGHSSGGGLVIRFAGSSYGHMAHAFLLLSPFLKYNAPTMRPASGGWARPWTGRIIGLSMLNNVGIRWWNHLTVIDFNMPKNARDGTETLSYSYRLNTAYAPGNYKKDLKAIKKPLLLAAGTADEAFLPEQFEPAMSPFVKADYKLLKGVTHMGVVVGSEIRPVIRAWLDGLSTG